MNQFFPVLLPFALFFIGLQPAAMARLADNELKPSSAAGAPNDLTLEQLELERDVFQKNLATVNEDIEKQLREFEKLDTDTADLENQESTLADLRAIIKRIGFQLYLWNVELEADQRIKVVEWAPRPQGGDALTKYVAVGFAGIVGFFFALLLVMQSPRRRWTSTIGSGLLLAGLSATAVWVLVPIHYEAQALIKVQKVLPVVIQNVRNGGVDEGAAYDIYKKTQLQLLKSNFVLSRAARRSEMAALRTMQEHKDDPVGFLERNLIVDYPGDAELMRVAFKGTRRDELPHHRQCNRRIVHG